MWQAELLRDVFGTLPFRPAPTLPAGLLERPDGLAVGMAKVVYAERSLPGGHLDAERLAVLADALEDGGAEDVLLEHLRSPGVHVRGCFALDLLLSKE